MAHLRLNQINIKKTGESCTIPNHPVGKLMYYLGCVNSVLNADLPSKLIDYKNYNSLSRQEIILVVNLADALDIRELSRAGVFIEVEDGSSVLGGSSNEFYNIQNTELEYLGMRGIQIGSLKYNPPVKVMFYSSSWKTKNYFDAYNQSVKMLTQPQVPRFINTGGGERPSSNACNIS